jgi:chloramphenicol-sensitive protein RarD
MWGLFPLYWPLLEPAGTVEILAHRIFWSLIVMLVLVVGMRRAGRVRTLLATRRTRRLLTMAAAVITVNWGVFIWGVNNGHVLEASLGYFINPLVSVLMGVVLLGERLRRLQWVAVGLAAVAVLGLTVEYGRPPWVALLLAFSFGSYGLAKKKADAAAVDSLTVETLILAPVALGYIIWLSVTGSSHFSSSGPAHALLLAGTGLVTAIPLICFGGAATRVTMTTLGMLQYLAPTIQFAIGLVVFHEPMTTLRWLGFGLIWVALVLFTSETIRHRREQILLSAQAAAV